MADGGPKLADGMNLEPAAGRLFFWGARALYLGPSFGLAAHRNAAAVLCEIGSASGWERVWGGVGAG